MNEFFNDKLVQGVVGKPKPLLLSLREAVRRSNPVFLHAIMHLFCDLQANKSITLGWLVGHTC